MTEKELNIKVGQRIAQLRKAKGLSQQQLAFLTDLEKQNISRLERGLVNSGIYMLYRITTAIEVSLSELFIEMEI